MELCSFSQIIVLVLLCLVGLGSYFCYDAPVALEVELKKHIGNPNLTQQQYNGLYYFYNYPNVIVCPLGGILVDTIGRGGDLISTILEAFVNNSHK